MPQVKKKAPAKKSPAKKPASRRKTPARGGKLQRAGAAADSWVQVAWQKSLSAAAVGVTALGLLALFALFAGGYFVNMGDRFSDLSAGAAKTLGFGVARVTVKGAHDLTDREVMRALWTDRDGSVLGRSLLHVDGQASRARLEALGTVRHAAVAKLWPNTLHISVVERSPAALWQDEAGALHLIDQDGVSLRPVAMMSYTDLPVVVGAEAPAEATDILAALRRHPALYRNIAAVVSVGGRRYDLRFRNDLTAKLPEAGPAGDGYEEALVRLEGLGAGTGDLAASLDYIDLRDPQWAYYKPKPE